MDIVRFASPWLLLLAIPAWGILLYGALASRPRRAGAAGRTALACLATGLLAAALGGPSVRVSLEDRCPVILVADVSPSMTAHRGSESADDALAPYVAALPPAAAGLVTFDATATTRVEPFTGAATAARPLPTQAAPGTAGTTAAAETNIQAGLEAVPAALPNGRGVVLLYSDGRQTQGDAVRAAGALAARGIRVFALMPDLRPRDVRIAGIAATPAAAGPAEPVTIEVRLAATLPAAATLRLRRAAADSASPAEWQRQVQPESASGAAAVFKDAPPASGWYVYHAQVSSAADEWPENNQASCIVRVGEGLDVAYVYAGESPGAALEHLRAKAAAGVRIRPVPAGAFSRPSPADAAVILDNVPAWALQPESLRDLAARVTDGGLGLVALGGDAAFGAGGYAESPLESLLPVSSRTGRRPPLEIVFVIDSSGSMNEMADGFTKLTHAKSAVLDLGSALGPSDRVGIVAFAGEPRIASPCAAASDWAQLRERLVGIEAGGGTRITPAVTAALGLFGPPDAAAAAGAVRHVVLLSDGRSADFDVPRLAAECRRSRASLSAVATGPDADRDRLGQLATDAGGRLYVLAGAVRQALRETFLKDMAWARGEGLQRQTRPARWQQAEPVWRRTGPPLPAVDAVNPAQVQPDADLLWQAEPAGGQQAAPLLAAWRKGLGKVAAMPWPVSRPSQAWLQDDIMGGYLSAILSWLCQAQAPADWSARLQARGQQWWVRVEEDTSALGKPQAPFAAAVFGERAGEAAQAALTQVAPGIYEGRVGNRGEGAAMVVVRRQSAGSEAAPAAVQLPVPGLPPLEYQHLGADRRQLEAIVQAGGGNLLDSPEALAQIVRRTEIQGYRPVGIYLVACAGVVAAAQVALRLAGRL
jgi:Mg-chelatase subunit ChlD